MIEKREWKGEWNFPGKTESYKGILNFDPVGGAMLELYGLYESGRGGGAIDIIAGKTTDGWVTLLDTRYDSGKYSNETSTGYSLYKPAIVLAGHAFQNKDELQFSSVHFLVFNLREWINFDAIEVEMQAKQVIEYKKPADIHFKCFPGCRGKIEFGFGLDYLTYPYQMQIDQHCKVVFTYEQLKPFRDILLDIFKFVGFVTLCTYEQSYPLQIEFYNEDIINDFISKSLRKKYVQPITCLYRNSFYQPYKKGNVCNYLVEYKAVADNISDIITAWFTKSKDELEQVIKLVLHTFVNKYEFTSQKFIDATRAIETFHRQNHNNEIISKDELKLIRQKINASDLSAEHKALVKEKLNFAFEPSLKQRLEEMVNLYSFPYFDERVPHKDKFVKQVRDARNYYTHFDKKLEKKAPILKELFNLTENVNLILFAAILKSIGIPSASIDQSVRVLVY